MAESMKIPTSEALNYAQNMEPSGESPGMGAKVKMPGTSYSTAQALDIAQGLKAADATGAGALVRPGVKVIPVGEGYGMAQSMLNPGHK